MSYQRVENVLYHAPVTVDATAKLALVTLASKLPDVDPHRTVGLSRNDLATAMAIEPRGVRRSLVRLAALGIEIRVAVGKDKHGEPLFAHRGTVGQYRLPWFPAPPGCACPVCVKAGTQAPQMGIFGDPEGVSTEAIGGPGSPPIQSIGGPGSPPKAEERGACGVPLSTKKEGLRGTPLSIKGGLGGPKGGPGGPPLPIPNKQPTLDARETGSEPGAETPSASSPVIAPTPARLPEAVQIISDALADEKISEDEARAVMRAFIAEARPRGLGLYRKIADEGGIRWRSSLAGIRAAAQEAAIAATAQLRRGPRCPHGEPGGDQLHPLHGQALCPLCRRGIPAVEVPAGPDPIETYRQIHQASHGEPPLELMTTVARQRHDLETRGIPRANLQAIAAAAAYAGLDLVTHLRNESERASA